MFRPPQDEILEILDDMGTEEHGTLVDEVLLKRQILLNNKVINILHLNIRSAKKNFDEFLLFIEFYQLYFCDIFVLSECFQILSCKMYNIPGYNTYYNNGDYNKNDGLLIFVRETLNTEVTHVKLKSSQATISRIAFEQGGLSFGLTAAYKPPPITELVFLNDLADFFEDSLNRDIEIFTGDLNIDIEKKQNPIANVYLSLMGQNGFVSYINSPTRVTHETSTCIDHLFIRKKIKKRNLKFKSFILKAEITDHYPIMLNVNLDEKPLNESEEQLNYYHHINYDLLKQHLSVQDWSGVLEAEDPEQATDSFVDIFGKSIQNSTSKRRIKNTNHKKIKDWITTGLITSIRHRDKLKNKLKQRFTEEQNTIYKIYRNKLNHLIKKQKFNFYKSQIEKNGNNVKKIYKVIADATNEKSKVKSSNYMFVDKHNHNFSNTLEMANFCNTYFINIGVEMEKKINNAQYPIAEKENLQNSLYLRPVTKNELIKQISTLKNDSAPGKDGISTRVIKHVHMEIIEPLMYIINLIFKTSIIPKHFKESVITPIYKNGEKNKIQNYRPISLINNFAKLFEKCLKERLVNFFDHNNIISPNQFGFSEGLSTADAMYSLISEITTNLDESKKVIAVFIDLAKAFDTVPHQRLLEVLSRNGVRGKVLELFKNYLSERDQFLKLNETLSHPLKIRIGVPQGTILGPILFITYINGLLNLNINGKIISYADDTVLVFTGETWEDTKEAVSRGFGTVKQWLDSFKLSLNISKTNYIAFSLTNMNRPNFTEIQTSEEEDSCVPAVKKIKYLGIIIDQHLKWTEHISYLTKKIRILIHKFYLLREFLCTKLIKLVYRSLVESLLRYGLVVWGGTYKSNLQPLTVIQNSILKVMFRKDRRYSTKALYNSEICNINCLYIHSICTYIHKKETLKRFVSHHHQTRANVGGHLVIPPNKKTINLKFANYLAPKFYNMIPKKIKDICRIKIFNEKSKVYIVNNYGTFSKLML